MLMYLVTRYFNSFITKEIYTFLIADDVLYKPDHGCDEALSVAGGQRGESGEKTPLTVKSICHPPPPNEA